MTTRIAVEHEFTASPPQVFGVLADRAFTERRMAIVPEMAARIATFAAGPATLEFTVDADLPASWMPAAIGGAPGITRHERWSLKSPDRPAEADVPTTVGPPAVAASPTAVAHPGYTGEIRVTVAGLPVTCGGELGVHPWQQGSIVSVVVDIQVDLPVFGPIVERMIRDRLEPAFAGELGLLAETVDAVP